MIDPTLMTGPAGDSLRGMTRGGDGAADGGSGFLERVARSLEELTGKTVSPDAVEDWLQGQGVPGFPTGDELAGLLDSMLPADGGALNAALSEGGQGDLDIAALLGAWAASSSTRLEGRPGVAAAASLTGALRADGGDMAEQLLAGLKAGPRNGGVPDRAMAALADGGDGDPAAFRQALGTFTAAGTGRGAPSLPPITQPVGQPGFGDAVGQRVTWMVRNDVQQARIQLNPPGLGPLEISVSLGEDKAHVGLTAHHALTRDALVADTSRLRAMLAESGFEQVDVDVSHREASSGGEEGGGDGGDARAGAGDGFRDPEGGAATTETVTVSRGNGLVDHYA